MISCDFDGSKRKKEVVWREVFVILTGDNVVKIREQKEMDLLPILATIF